MFTATVQITINQFKPISYSKKKSYIDATLAPPKNTSPTGSGGSKVFSGDGQSIYIKVPKTYAGAVKLTYQLADPNYVLVGVAMKPVVMPDKSVIVGRQEFRTIMIDRDPSGSQMTVTDACVPKFNKINFQYVILVECCTGDDAGKIGEIDPDIENEGGESP